MLSLISLKLPARVGLRTAVGQTWDKRGLQQLTANVIICIVRFIFGENIHTMARILLLDVTNSGPVQFTSIEFINYCVLGANSASYPSGLSV